MADIQEMLSRIKVAVVEQQEAILMQTIQEIGGEEYRIITVDKSRVISAFRRAMPADFTPAIDNGIIMAGFCPTCNGSVEIEKTYTRKQKGACCSWCGQRLRIKKLLDD